MKIFLFALMSSIQCRAWYPLRDLWWHPLQSERRLHHIIHKSKTEWIFSGTVRNENGVMQDAGFLRSPHPMRRAQALKYFAKAFPRANMIHVDDKNKIITYSF